MVVVLREQRLEGSKGRKGVRVDGEEERRRGEEGLDEQAGWRTDLFIFLPMRRTLLAQGCRWLQRTIKRPEAHDTRTKVDLVQRQEGARRSSVYSGQSTDERVCLLQKRAQADGRPRLAAATVR